MELTKGNAAAAQMLTEQAADAVSEQGGGLERIPHAEDWADEAQEEGLNGVQGAGLDGQLGGAKIVKGPGVRGTNSQKYSIWWLHIEIALWHLLLRTSVGGNGARRATRGTSTSKGTGRTRAKAGEKGRRDDVTMGEHEGVAQGASRGAGQAKKAKAGGERNLFLNGQGARGRGAVTSGKVVRASADVGVGGKEEKVRGNRRGERGGAEDDDQDDEEDEV
jgi:hypothetical protein